MPVTIYGWPEVKLYYKPDIWHNHTLLINVGGKQRVARVLSEA